MWAQTGRERERQASYNHDLSLSSHAHAHSILDMLDVASRLPYNTTTPPRPAAHIIAGGTNLEHITVGQLVEADIAGFFDADVSST